MFCRTIILRCFQEEEGGVCLPLLPVPCSPSLLRAWGAGLGGVPRHPPCSLGPDRDLLMAFVCSLAGEVGSTEIWRRGASKAAGRVTRVRGCFKPATPERGSPIRVASCPPAPEPRALGAREGTNGLWCVRAPALQGPCTSRDTGGAFPVIPWSWGC